MAFDEKTTNELRSSASLLINDKKSMELLSEAIKRMKPSWRRIIFLFIVSLIFSPICYRIGFSKETIELMIKNIEFVNSVVLALFAIIVTGYAIFQALSSDDLIFSLLSYKVKDEPYFRIFNIYFLGIASLYLISISVNFVAIFFLKNIDPHYSVSFLSNLTANIITTCIIFVYFFYHLFLITEVKSFLFNLYQGLNIYALSKISDLLKTQQKQD